jgi:hypothetical protein
LKRNRRDRQGSDLALGSADYEIEIHMDCVARAADLLVTYDTDNKKTTNIAAVVGMRNIHWSCQAAKGPLWSFRVMAGRRFLMDSSH